MAGYVYSVYNEIKKNDQSFEGQSQRRCMLNERLMTLYTHIRYVVLKVVQITYQLTNGSINQSKIEYAYQVLDT